MEQSSAGLFVVLYSYYIITPTGRERKLFSCPMSGINPRLPRQYIPTALHSELNEYSSLLRALRTNNILDVSHHLTQHGRADSSSSDESDQESDEPSSATDEPVTGEKRKRPVRKRDTWTRWPLLLNDLHQPTWSFQDEIATAALQILKLFPPPSFSQEESRSEDDASSEPDDIASQDDHDDQHDTDEDDPDRQPYFKYIAMSASTFLSDILVLLSSNIPPRPPSMQNRIEPLDWRSILEIVSVAVDEEYVFLQPFPFRSNHLYIYCRIINKVKVRMEELYDLPPGSSFPQTEEGENLRKLYFA